MNWQVPSRPDDNEALVCGSEGRLILETYEYNGRESAELKGAAEWLCKHALPDDKPHEYFRNKLREDLVVLPDEDFKHFVKYATAVEPHVRIDDVSGTADEGGLFYTENLPPESIMLGLVMASVERYKKGSKPNNWMDNPEHVLDKVIKGVNRRSGIDNRLLQIGGDATTGRGQVIVHCIGGNGHGQ